LPNPVRLSNGNIADSVDAFLTPSTIFSSAKAVSFAIIVLPLLFQLSFQSYR
jgi:hypothetical protein